MTTPFDAEALLKALGASGKLFSFQDVARAAYRRGREDGLREAAQARKPKPYFERAPDCMMEGCQRDHCKTECSALASKEPPR